jgi:hypothetical protein
MAQQGDDAWGGPLSFLKIPAPYSQRPPSIYNPGSGWSGRRPGCGANFAEAATAIAESRSVCSLRLFAKHAERMRR